MGGVFILDIYVGVDIAFHCKTVQKSKITLRGVSACLRIYTFRIGECKGSNELTMIRDSYYEFLYLLYIIYSRIIAIITKTLNSDNRRMNENSTDYLVGKLLLHVYIS